MVEGGPGDIDNEDIQISFGGRMVIFDENGEVVGISPEDVEAEWQRVRAEQLLRMAEEPGNEGAETEPSDGGMTDGMLAGDHLLFKTHPPVGEVEAEVTSDDEPKTASVGATSSGVPTTRKPLTINDSWWHDWDSKNDD